MVALRVSPLGQRLFGNRWTINLDLFASHLFANSPSFCSGFFCERHGAAKESVGKKIRLALLSFAQAPKAFARAQEQFAVRGRQRSVGRFIDGVGGE